METAEGVIIRHPNREKAESKATKLVCVVVLLVSAALTAIILLGGWAKLEGAEIVAIAYVIIYVLMAYFVARWSRGVLPMAAGLAVIFTTMLIVAAPAWFARDKEGLTDPALPPELLGLLTIILIGVQILLVIVAARAFSQKWNIELEVHPDGDEGRAAGGSGPSVAGGWA